MPENPRIEELRRRVQADPASIAFAGLAEEFRRVGRYDEAIETCRVGLQRHPAYLSARVTLGRALIETGDFEGAREELETVLQSAPENLAAIRGLAQIHERLGHSTEMDPHLAALMHADIPAPPPPVAPPPPATTRAAAPNFDLDLNFNVAPPRAAEGVSEFPADDSPFAPAPASVPERELVEDDGLGDAFSASFAEPEPAVSPPPESFGFATPASSSRDVPAPDAFDLVESESVVLDPEAPSTGGFAVRTSEPVPDAAAAHDVFDIIASEPMVLDAAGPPPDVFHMAAPEPVTSETAAPEPESPEEVPSEPEVPAASVPLTMGVRRSPDLNLGLTFTLPPTLAPPRDSAADFSLVEASVPAVPDAPALEPLPASAPVMPALEARPDPEIAATLARLEGFLAAIQGSRVQGSEGRSLER